MRLSKTQFIRGLQCPKSLWLFKNKPSLRTKPDENLLARFQSGTDVGELAQQLFPGGETLIFDFKKINENISKTQDYIKAGVKTIYEATFLYDDVLVMVDILHHGADGWELYEVKSSTSVKDVYQNDVAIQYYVVNGTGLNVSSTALVHINNQYVRQGPLDIRSLFTIAPLTDITLQKQPTIKTTLQQLKHAVAPGTQVPDRDIGPYCFDPYECDFKAHCWSHVREPSVFSLASMKSDRKFELYYQGIINFDQIHSDLNLTDAQQMQVNAELHGKEYIKPHMIKEFLSTIQQPAGFMDFETFMQAVPQFNDQKPFQQIPFQYSLHLQKNDTLKHLFYLAESGIDPRLEFIQRLINDTRDCASILVYNISFERRILSELADLCPQYGGEIQGIINRLIDLMTVFQSKSYYVKEMNGSYSIKNVLPAISDDLSYKQLEISDGGMAMNAFPALQGMTDAEEIRQIRDNLLEYCKLDTLAMVEILDKLRTI